MAHKGMLIGGICTSGAGVTVLTNFFTIPLSLSSNPTLQALGAIISFAGVALVVGGCKKS